jgi:integrase
MHDIRTLNEATELMLGDLALSPLTRETYRYGIQAFVRFLHLADGNVVGADTLAAYPIERIHEGTLTDFARYLRDAYPDPRKRAGLTRTGLTYIAGARALLNWLDLNELLAEGVSYDRMLRKYKGVAGQRREGYHQRRTDPDVIRVLSHYLNEPLPKTRSKRLILLRNRALMAVLYDTGCRISEALALTREDVLDGRAPRLHLTTTKNAKPRVVFLAPSTRALIQDYVRQRDDSIYAPLFVSHGRRAGQAITSSHAWLLVKEAARAEGLYDNTSPHSLRHRRAQDLLNEGMPLEWVSALLGHRHTDTTRVVYAWETDEGNLEDMIHTYGVAPRDAAQQADERQKEIEGTARKIEY